MKSISFNNNMDKLTSKDIISFMHYLVGKPDVKSCEVFVNSYEITYLDYPNSLNCEVKINFQTFKGKGNNRVSTLYVFRNMRAVDFCCQSMSHTQRT